MSTVVYRTSMISGKEHSMELPLTPRQLLEGMAACRCGVLIQDAFPTLTLTQREFLMTGITLEEWDAAFGSES